MPIQHGAMLGVWRKTLTSHRNEQREMLQTQKAIVFFCCLVAAAKPPRPHKETKQSSASF